MEEENEKIKKLEDETLERFVRVLVLIAETKIREEKQEE